MGLLTFADMIAPVTTRDFFTNYWERNFLHIHNSNPAFFDHILDIAAIDDYLAKQNLKPEGIRLVNKGHEVPASEWTKQSTLADGTINRLVVTQKLLTHYHNGASIILSFADYMIQGLADAMRMVEQELGINMQANIYITPPCAQGFNMHYDSHDIFMMQIKGPKKWRIYDSGEELPTSLNPFRNEPKLIEEIELNSGDFMYMPRGLVHEAFSSGASTIHVNFTLKPRYGFDMIADLAKIAEAEDVFFRRTIPHAYNTEEEKQAYIKMFAKKLAELTNTHTAAQLLAQQKTHFIEKQLLNLQGRFADAIAIEQLSLESTVSHRKGFEYQVKEQNNLVVISFGTQKIAIPKFVEKDIFLGENSFKVKDIRGLITPDNKLNLVRDLIKAGFLQIDMI